MSLLCFEFILRFLWGAQLCLFFVSRKESSERFPRIACLIGLCTSAIFYFILRQSLASTSQSIYFLSYLSFCLGSLLYAYFKFRAFRVLGFLLCLFSPLFFLWGQGPILWLNFASGAMILGSILSAQYVGHWYLTVAGMHIRELRLSSQIMLGAVAFKFLEVLFSLGHRALYHQEASALSSLLNSSLFSLEGNIFLNFGSFGLILISARLLWGLVSPLILSFMVLHTTNKRSTQSATGILYAMSIMVIIGEGIALFLKNSIHFIN